MPPEGIRDPRDLTRLRKTLVRERRSHVVNRVGKVLELANLKLGSVVSNVMGGTGRAILAAMMAGEDDPEALASLAKGQLATNRGVDPSGGDRPFRSGPRPSGEHSGGRTAVDRGNSGGDRR